MPDAPDKQRLIEDLQRSLAEGWLEIGEVSERLAPSELRLLREKPDLDEPWSHETRRRLAALRDLAEGRRSRASVPGGPPAAAVRPDGASGDARDLHVLLVGFTPADRERLVDLLESTGDPVMHVRSASSVEQAPTFLARERFDAALLDLTGTAASRSALLARAEVATAGVPVVAVVNRGDDPQLARVTAHESLVMSEIDSPRLVEKLTRVVEQQRLSEALESSLRRKHFFATRDTMTGLPNRLAFQEQLGHALRYSERHDQQVAVLSASVDGLKPVREALGHEVSDSVLIALAGRMAGAVRKSDAVARVAQDEFMLMLHGRECGFAPERTAERVLDSSSNAFVVGGREHTLRTSIGIAIFPRDGCDPDTLMRNATAAGLQARAEGRDGYRFYGHAAGAVDVRRRRIAERLRGVFERGDLELVYRPRVDARDGKVVGAQALLHWNDTELGSLSPAEFMPVADEAELVDRIGAWALREACLAQRSWDAAGFGDVRVCLNVSQHQICTLSLREAVVDAVIGVGLAPGRLEIELMESALSENQEGENQLLRELAEIGVDLSLDDFGTGLPSLCILRDLPVRTLKLDPSFVHDITRETLSSHSVDSVVSLARTLDLCVVADGVETELQRDLLLERGCSQMQGLLFGAPVAGDRFLDLLQHGGVGGAKSLSH